MFKSNEQTLVIVIRDSDPQELREQMLKDIGAVMRWFASSDGRHQTDDAALYRWGRFLEALSVKG